MYVLVESAALWTIFVTINFILFLARTNLRFMSLDMMGPVIGISFCLIIVRLGPATEQRVSLPSLRTADFAVQTMTAGAAMPYDTAREGSGQGARNHHQI
ncbi:hypothetical protein BDM02DRAFT_3108636 [Thelephora ganbajun]|uniref:Uncharacterized protein n=1 Tax=Thelephora ganbajun TaxID=370292 RepID=A0ACB6ZTV4_THEGA|nr:hypothetical protein BDM02DRAFT_3108636 [Thelephora ganbajun]